jgi:E3 ubiquitin-protein ligase UBR7
LFLPEGWRQQLCECSACLQLYEDSGLSFLTSLADTVHHYESQVSLGREEFFI